MQAPTASCVSHASSHRVHPQRHAWRSFMSAGATMTPSALTALRVVPWELGALLQPPARPAPSREQLAPPAWLARALEPPPPWALSQASGCPARFPSMPPDMPVDTATPTSGPSALMSGAATNVTACWAAHLARRPRRPQWRRVGGRVPFRHLNCRLCRLAHHLARLGCHLSRHLRTMSRRF